MAQLFFRYGSMNSGKSIEIIKVAHNYEEQNKHVMMFTSALDTRRQIGYISSRIGLTREATPLYPDTNLFDLVAASPITLSCVLVDEAHMLKGKHILECTRVVDELNIPVICFGLKNDFRNHIFESSLYLLTYADKIEEIKTICWFCEKKATMNLRLGDDGKPTREGEQFVIGANERYYSVCRKCYNNPPL